MSTQALIGQLHNVRWREILSEQLDANTSAYARHSALWKPLSATEKVGFLKSELAPDAHDCELLVRIALVGVFPSSEPWRTVGSEILSWFWTVQHPSFASVIEQNYHIAPDAERGAALTLLSCQDTPPATEVMIKLIKEHGLPQDKFPPRFFWELNRKHAAIAPRLFPELLSKAGAELAGVMNYLNVALEAGHLSAESLRPVAEWSSVEAIKLLDQVEPMQRLDGTQWRTGEDYFPLRSRLGVHLDLLGIIPEAPTEPLQRAVKLKDPGPVLFALVSLLKRGMQVPAEAITLCARSHETRAELYRQLQHLNRLEFFPAEFLTFEAFAAAAMVQWLLYPAELGYEPVSLELIAQVEGKQEEETVVMCLWKFVTEEGKAYAGASGPHPASRPVEPLWGQDTFSNFTEWHTLEPEQHLKGILETLEDWSVAWCEGRM